MKTKMNSRQDLILNWLRNIKWEHLTEWERDFVDSVWVRGILLTKKQSNVIDDVYRKIRFGEPFFYYYTEEDIGEYQYIHDFDK